jgi:hypothetical protein
MRVHLVARKGQACSEAFCVKSCIEIIYFAVFVSHPKERDREDCQQHQEVSPDPHHCSASF